MTSLRPPSPRIGAGANLPRARSATSPAATPVRCPHRTDLVVTEPDDLGRARGEDLTPAAGHRRARRVPSCARPSAVLDTAHLGDIEGAFGRVRVADTDQRRTLKTRLLTLLAIIGPGLIVMVGDNDAGGVSTYAQAGQNYGYSLLWVMLLLIPVLIVNQEMVVRLGAVTGVGHARLINERFGRGWGWFSVGDLFLLNFLTIVTEFIGVSLVADYFGISAYIVVPPPRWHWWRSW